VDVSRSLYFLLLSAKHCCHLLVRKVANKMLGSLHSTEYCEEDGIKWGGGGGDKIFGEKSFFLGAWAKNVGKMESPR